MDKEFSLSFDCPDCARQWSIVARVRRDDACPRCGSVSLPTRTRVIDEALFPRKLAWQPIPR